MRSVSDSESGTMKLTATYHGGTRYDIVSGKHRVITDQSAEDGGQDAGMGPVELFVDLGAEVLLDDLEATPADRQTALFSATMPSRIGAIAARHLRDPARIAIAREEVAHIRSLSRQINALELELRHLVKAHRPQLLAETGRVTWSGPAVGRRSGSEVGRRRADAASGIGSSSPVPSSLPPPRAISSCASSSSWKK